MKDGSPSAGKGVLNLPNMLSASRVVLLPVLCILAWRGNAVAFLIVLGCSFATDSVDGPLARKLGVESAFGSRLDTIGDLGTYLGLPLFAYWLWPHVVLREIGFIIPVILSCLLPILAALLKFRGMTSYHTYLAKLAAVLMSVSAVLLFSGLTPIPFRMFAIVPVLAGVEEMMITFVLPKPHANVHTLRHALRIAKAEREG